MEILIKLDERLYENIKHHTLILGEIDEICDAISNGTPLPKGHGRLKDVDWIDDNCLDYRTDDDGSWCYKWRDIDNAPTIVEADKEI